MPATMRGLTGRNRRRLSPELDEVLWKKIIDVNLNGVMLCMKYEVPAMLKQGGGVIVNIASTAGITQGPGAYAYTASKHGVVGLTKVAAVAYAKAGIRVNSVCPGFVETPMTAGAPRGTQAAGRGYAYRSDGSESPKRLPAPLCGSAQTWLVSLRELPSLWMVALLQFEDGGILILQAKPSDGQKWEA